MTAQDATNSLLEYARLLVDVQDALRRGDERSATLARRKSGAPGNDLSLEEIDWLYGLSGDLDMLTGEEVFERSKLSPRQLLLDLRSATYRLDGQAMLDLLRQNPTLLLPQQKAYLRANAYDHLGYTELSLLFMRHAAELAPDDDQYLSLILEKLGRLGRLDEARALALAALDRPNLSVNLVIFSAGAIFSSTRGMDDGATRPLLVKVVEVLAPILSTKTSVAQMQPAEYVYALLTLGCCHEKLYDLAAARQVFGVVLDFDPSNADVFILRGNTNLDGDRTQAVSDYQRAVSLGTTTPTPYIVLAYEAVMEGQYLKCEELCQQLLGIPQLPINAHSLALEFLAICYFYLDQPDEQVRKTFQEAIDVNPNNERLRHLAQSFSDNLASRRQKNIKSRFSSVILSDLQDLGRSELTHSQLLKENSELIYRAQRREVAIAI